MLTDILGGAQGKAKPHSQKKECLQRRKKDGIFGSYLLTQFSFLKITFSKVGLLRRANAANGQLFGLRTTGREEKKVKQKKIYDRPG